MKNITKKVLIKILWNYTNNLEEMKSGEKYKREQRKAMYKCNREQWSHKREAQNKERRESSKKMNAEVRFNKGWVSKNQYRQRFL